MGWWILIDAISVYPSETTALHIILGIMGTISLVMVNSVTQAQVCQINCRRDYPEYFEIYSIANVELLI